MSPIDAIATTVPQAVPLNAVPPVRRTAQVGESLPWAALLALHLLPGLLIGAMFVLLARLVEPGGAPANLALLLAMLLVALPVELGSLLWLGWRDGGAWILRGLIGHQDALPRRQALVLIPLFFVWSVVAYTLLAPLAKALHHALLDRWPAWLHLNGLALHLDQLLLEHLGRGQRIGAGECGIGDQDGLGGAHGEGRAKSTGLVVRSHGHERDLASSGRVHQLQGHLDAVGIGVIQDELALTLEEV